MNTKTITIGGIDFGSRNQARRHASAILNANRQGDYINEGSQEFSFLMGLIEMHPERIQKTGAGIHRFFVAPPPEHSGICFWIQRKDGSETDFGIGACIDSKFQNNKQSLRQLVQPQIDAFKKSRIKPDDEWFVSDFSGLLFRLCDLHVHHVPDFAKLVLEFFENRKENISADLLTESKDASSVAVFKDPGMAGEFLRFHSKAKLMLVSAFENLSTLKKL